MRCRLRMSRTGLQIGSVVVADWRDDAVCATTDPDLFFPESRDVRAERQAKKICAGCPVVQDCLEYAIEAGEEFGVWGGTTELERRHMMSIPRRNAGGKPQIDRVKFWQLQDAGLTALEIAELLGCHADSVSRMRQERRP